MGLFLGRGQGVGGQGVGGQGVGGKEAKRSREINLILNILNIGIKISTINSMPRN